MSESGHWLPAGDSRADYARPPEQAAREAAMRAVSATLNYIEDSIQHAEDGRRLARAAPDCGYIDAALRAAAE